MRKHIGLVIAALSAAAAILAALTGCAAVSTSYDDDPSEYPWATYTSVVQLPDGREVICVYANSTAISCDWISIAPKPLEEEAE